MMNICIHLDPEQGKVSCAILVDMVNGNAQALFNMAVPWNLEKNNAILCAELATELVKTTSYVASNLAPGNDHIVHVTLPKAIKDVILHA
jgi:hypothetical protein